MLFLFMYFYLKIRSLKSICTLFYNSKLYFASSYSLGLIQEIVLNSYVYLLRYNIVLI